MRKAFIVGIVLVGLLYLAITKNTAFAQPAPHISMAAALATLNATSTPTPKPTATPLGGGEGKITFMSRINGVYQIYLMNANGSNIQPLTDGAENKMHPAWSSDGKNIAFTSVPAQMRFGDSTLHTKIYIMASDGSNMHPLFPGDNDFDDTDPSWSPDGKQIVFSSDRQDETFHIYTCDVSGTNPVQLTFSPGHTDTAPSWSPDGKYIVFSSGISFSDNEIYAMNADGSNSHKVSTYDTSSYAYWPSWSPDGKQIVLDNGGDIYIIRATNGQARRLTNGGLKGSYGISWSSDGNLLAYNMKMVPKKGDGNSGHDIVTLDLRTGRLQWLTHNLNEDNAGPRWQP